MATTGHETEAVNVQGLKASLQKFKTDKVDGKADKVTVTAGSYNKVSVNAQGIVTAGENPTTLAGHGITDAYTKTEVNGLVDTPHQNYVTVQATDQTTAATDVLPASGQAADTIYRVSNWDGSANSFAGAFDVTVYSEYAWDDVSNPNKYVFLAVKTQIGEVFDISVYNNNAEYADLSAALGTNGANVPAEIRRGGMSVKFVCSSDNKYVQYRLTADEFSTDIYDWVTIPIEVEETLYGDLVFSDEGGNCILSVSNHIRTKDFDSKDIVSNMQQLDQSIIEINETIEEDLPSFKDDEIFDSGITDEDLNILVSFYEGHIKTKNFDSKEVLEVLQQQAGVLSDVQEELNEHEEILNNLPQIPKCKDQSETSEYITVLNDNFQTQTNIWEESWNRPQNGTFTPQNLNQVAKTSKRFFSDKRQVKIKTTLYNDVVLNIYSTNAQEASSYIIDLVNKKINLGTEEYSIQDISITNGAEHEIVISIQNFVTKISIYNTQTNGVTEIEMFGRQDYELKGKLCLKQTQGTLISITDFSISVLKNPTILFLGDSITAGAYFRSIVESEGMYVYHVYTKLIGNIIGDCITVAGGGENMYGFTEMWENEIQFMSPKAISALVGTNGGFSLQQITTLMSNLLTVAQKLFVHHLFGTNSTYHLANYNQILEQALAQQEFSEVKSARLDIATSTQKSENTAENVTLDTSLMYDRVIHPNYEGSKAIVNRMKFDCPELFRLN